jgi:4-amino-4-deoxy-L-arabinose transferase-like glycosyltransferase
MYLFSTYALDLGAPGKVRIPNFGFGFEVGQIAASLVNGRGFANVFGGDTGPTAVIAPVYPTLVAVLMKIFGVYTRATAAAIFTMNSLFAAFTCPLMIAIARRSVGERPGKIAAWMFALCPLFIHWATAWIWEVSLSALLLTLLVFLSLELREDDSVKAWVRFGVLWGIAGLTNPSLLAALPVTGLVPAWRLFKEHKNWLRAAAVSSLVFWITLSPWLIRNRIVFGDWVFIRDNFGLEFWIGNFPGSNWMGWHQMHPTYHPDQYARWQSMGERAYIKSVSDLAMGWVKNDPKHFLDETGKRFWYFWTGEVVNHWKEPPLHYEQWMYWPLSALGWMGWLHLFFRKREAAVLFGGVMLFYPAAYYITFLQIRYRHSIEPLLLLLAAYWLVAMFNGARELIKSRATPVTA